MPLIVCLLLSAAFLDQFVPGVFRDAFRQVLFAQSEQLALIAIALIVASLVLRFACEFMIGRFAEGLVESPTVTGAFYRSLPSIVGFIPAVLVALPLLQLIQDPTALSLGVDDAGTDARKIHAIVAACAFLICGSAVAAVPRLSSRAIASWIVLGAAAACFLIAVALTVIFLDLKNVWLPQRLGAVTIVLLWAFAVTALSYPLTLAASFWRIPVLTTLMVYAVGLSFFDFNDNHEVRIYESPYRSQIPKAAGPSAPIIGLNDFSTWLGSRSDLDEYDHYPVFIVATEGGALRSAYYTASLLAALQDMCPAFAEHTYLISSVSGGSIGGAAFAASAANEDQVRRARREQRAGCILTDEAPDTFKTLARSMLSADMFSPVLSALLFPDALQRILPLPIGSFDRVRALEYTVEKAWRDANPCTANEPDYECEGRQDRFSAPLSSLTKRRSDETAGAAVPYLLPNITEVETGHPEALRAPFARGLGLLNPDCPTQAPDATPCLNDRIGRASLNIPLSTAAVLSARFPYLTPAGLMCWPRDPNARGGLSRVSCTTPWDATLLKRRYVDGAYFENSGTWFGTQFAAEILRQRFDPPPRRAGETAEAVAGAQALPFVQIIVLVLRATPTSETQTCTDSAPSSSARERSQAAVVCAAEEIQGLNEVMSPLRALLNTRVSRADVSKRDSRQLQEVVRATCNGAKGCAPNPSSYPAAIDGVRKTKNYPFTILTFQLHDGPETKKVDRDTIPFSWLLSDRSRILIDKAVDFVATPESWRINWETRSDGAVPASLSDRYAVLGDAAYVLCVLHMRKDIVVGKDHPCLPDPSSQRWFPHAPLPRPKPRLPIPPRDDRLNEPCCDGDIGPE